MRYVTIGGSGFVGKELGNLLLRKGEGEIVNLDLIPSGLPVQDVQQDITQEIQFQFRTDDIVVHLAANQYHHKVPKKNRQAFFENVNVAGTQNILNLPVPMIGSGKNYYQMVSVQDCAAAIDQAIRHQLPNKSYNLGSINPPTVKDLLGQVIRRNHSKSILIPTWGKAVKMTLGVLGWLGLEMMYKEQYMIADENYIIDISETRQDLDWIPQFNDTDMMLASFEEYQKLKNMMRES